MRGFWVVAVVGFVTLTVIDRLPVEIRGTMGLVMGAALASYHWARHGGPRS